MIINGHDQCRGHAPLPGVISEGLAQGMAADGPADLKVMSGIFDNMKGPCAVNRAVFSLPALENVAVLSHAEQRRPP